MIFLTLDEQTLRYIERVSVAGHGERLYEDIVRRWRRTGLLAAGRITKGYLSGQRLRRRTGQAAGAITAQAEVEGGAPAVHVGAFRGPSLAYLGVQEEGTRGLEPESPYADIVPRRARSLAIPVDESLTPAGVPRYPGPREDPRELHFVPVLRGRLVGFLAQEGGPPQWLLVRRVMLRARHFLRDGMEEAVPLLLGDVTRAVEEAIA